MISGFNEGSCLNNATFRVVVIKMAGIFHFALVLVDNFVYSSQSYEYDIHY